MILHLLLFSVASAQTPIEEELTLFRKDPAAYAQRIPRKRGAPSALRVNEAVRKKIREGILENEQRAQAGARHFAVMNSADPTSRVENLLENGHIIRTLPEMETLRTGEVAVQPWSDDYWPVYRGVLGARYTDTQFPMSKDWKQNLDFVKSFPSLSIFQSAQADKIAQLSPSEKYDLLMGDQLSLTARMWSEGKQYYDNNAGQVEFWMGICHGWAPASYQMERPIRKVEVMASDQKTLIPFYPADVRGLASLLWANSPGTVRLLGGRCNERGPARDENGRVTKPECFDVNPAAWHIALVNQIGVTKRSLIMDATYDFEVWNQPIRRYTYSYFHPKTKARVATMEQAQIALNEFPEDRFKKYRSRDAHSVVGIAMQVTYMIEVVPMASERDTEANDGQRAVVYLYDVELDANGQMIGGEWYQEMHPDFIWTAARGARAKTLGDVVLLSEPDWDGQAALSARWVDQAEVAASRGAPLARVVESLIALSRKGN